MRIIELEQYQTTHQNTEITVAGAVRAAYTKPFAYFLLQDASATLICRPTGSPPYPGAHIEITGRFVVETPENCTLQLAILNEKHRQYIFHPTYACDLPGCEFANMSDAVKLREHIFHRSYTCNLPGCEFCNLPEAQKLTLIGQ